MSSHKDSIQDRLNRAAEAKNALLAKFKQAADPDNPEAVEKRRQREALVAAREERMAQRRIAQQEHERVDQTPRDVAAHARGSRTGRAPSRSGSRAEGCARRAIRRPEGSEEAAAKGILTLTVR